MAFKNFFTYLSCKNENMLLGFKIWYNSTIKRNLFYKCYDSNKKYSFDNIFGHLFFYTVHFEIQLKV